MDTILLSSRKTKKKNRLITDFDKFRKRCEKKQEHLYDKKYIEQPLKKEENSLTPSPPEIDTSFLEISNQSENEMVYNQNFHPPEDLSTTEQEPSSEPMENETWCLYCKMESCVIEEGHLICKQCGSILKICYDDSAEWRYYGNDTHQRNDPCRCGIASNYLYPDYNTGSIIGYGGRHSYSMKKIIRNHNWNSSTNSGKNLSENYELMQIRCTEAGISQMIIDHAKLLYKKISENQLFRGDNKFGLVAMCVYKACMDKGVGRNIKEIASVFGLDESTMTKGNRCYNKICMALEKQEQLSMPQLQFDQFEPEDEDLITRPSHYTERFVSKLNLPSNVREDIEKLVVFIEQTKLILDNTPSAIASAVIYMVIQLYNLNISRSDIAKITQKSEVTILKCYKKLQKYEPVLRNLIGH